MTAAARTDVSDLVRGGVDAGELGQGLAEAPPVNLALVRSRRGGSKAKAAADPELAALQVEAGMVEPPKPEASPTGHLDLDAEAATHGEAWPLDRRGPHPPTQRQLALTKESFPRACYSNAVVILQKDPRWATLRLNLLNDVVEHDGKDTPELTLVAQAAVWLSQNYGLHLGSQPVKEALYAVATERAYSPIQDYLRGLTWDGQGRIQRLLPEVFGLPATPLYETYLRRFMVGAVARALSPGCKVDTALIFVGQQGAKKSSFFQTLFGAAWFSDSPIPIGSKEAGIQLRATWGYEAAEMEDLNKRTAEAVKQFMSSSSDLFRGLWERGARRRLRSSVLCGSCNKPQFLSDETGHRRFWPLPVPDEVVIRNDLVRAWRDQLWAEALVLYEAAQSSIDAGETPAPGLRWWFERDEERERAGDVAQFVESHPWEETIKRWLPRAVPFTTTEVLTDCLRLDAAQQNQVAARQAGRVLITLGYVSKVIRQENDTFLRRWVREGARDAAPPPEPVIPL